MPIDRFRKLIGDIISICGVLELRTNFLIQTLAKDSLLASEIFRFGFKRRVDILQRLMLERTDVPPREVKKLCADLKRVADERNKVAHNPIADLANPHILVIRELSTTSKDLKLYETDLKNQLTRIHAALKELKEFVGKVGVPPYKRSP
jgi:hypothetical protein